MVETLSAIWNVVNTNLLTYGTWQYIYYSDLQTQYHKDKLRVPITGNCTWKCVIWPVDLWALIITHLVWVCKSCVLTNDPPLILCSTSSCSSESDTDDASSSTSTSSDQNTNGRNKKKKCADVKTSFLKVTGLANRPGTCSRYMTLYICTWCSHGILACMCSV